MGHTTWRRNNSGTLWPAPVFAQNVKENRISSCKWIWWKVTVGNGSSRNDFIQRSRSHWDSTIHTGTHWAEISPNAQPVEMACRRKPLCKRQQPSYCHSICSLFSIYGGDKDSKISWPHLLLYRRRRRRAIKGEIGVLWNCVNMSGQILEKSNWNRNYSWWSRAAGNASHNFDCNMSRSADICYPESKIIMMPVTQLKTIHSTVVTMFLKLPWFWKSPSGITPFQMSPKFFFF